jgi:acetylornithine/succinyldiaminopimelate/putrescine aminotransferase
VLAGARSSAERLAKGLGELRQRHPFFTGVRQKGLVMGLETAGDGGAIRLSRALYQRGVWAMFSGFAPSVLQWKVGLLADAAYCDALLERLDAALGDVERAGSA